MKISKVTWIFLFLGILIIAGASLGMAQSQLSAERDRLQQELSQAQQRLALIHNEDLMNRQKELESQVRASQSQIESVRSKLTSSEDSISATELILETARNFAVAVVSISSSGTASEDLAGIRMVTLSIGIEVKGEIDKIKDFAIDLSRQFPTCVVKEVQIKSEWRSDTEFAGEPESENPESQSETALYPASGTISLVIYNYRGE